MEYRLKILNILCHQEVGRKLPKGHEEKRRIKRPDEKRFRSYGENRYLVSTGCNLYLKNGLYRDNGQYGSGCGLEEQLKI